MRFDPYIYSAAQQVIEELLDRQLQQGSLQRYDTHALNHAITIVHQMDQDREEWPNGHDVSVSGEVGVNEAPLAGLSLDQAYRYRTSDGEEGTFRVDGGEAFPVSDGPNPHAVDPNGLFSERTPASVRSVGEIGKRVSALEDLLGVIGRRLDATVRHVRGIRSFEGQPLQQRVEELEEGLDRLRKRDSWHVAHRADLTDSLRQIEKRVEAVDRQCEHLGTALNDHRGWVIGRVGESAKRVEKLDGRTEDLNSRIAGVERTVNEAVATSLVNLDRQLDHARKRTNGLDDRVEKLESMDTAVTKQSVKDIADLLEAVSDEIGADAVRRVENIVNRFGARLGALEAGGVVPAEFRGIGDLVERLKKLEQWSHEPKPVPTVEYVDELKKRVEDLEAFWTALGVELHQDVVGRPSVTIGNSPVRDLLEQGKDIRGLREYAVGLEDRIEHLEAHVETLVEWREEWEGSEE